MLATAGAVVALLAGARRYPGAVARGYRWLGGAALFWFAGLIVAQVLAGPGASGEPLSLADVAPLLALATAAAGVMVLAEDEKRDDTGSVLPGLADGFVSPQDLPTRKTGTNTAQSTPDDRSNSADNRLRNPDAPAPSRIGNIPTYGLPAASGASTSGYNSLNRKRQKAKLYPGQPKPKVVGPGNRAPDRAGSRPKTAAAEIAAAAVGDRQPDADPAGDGRHRARPAVLASASRSTTIRSARSAITPAVSWSRPRWNSWVAMTPIPAAPSCEKGSPFYVVAPELLVVSDWERHAMVADLRGSYTGYTNTFPPENGVVSSAPTDVNRPDFIGHVDGRLDVTNDTHLLGQARLRVTTDNPGSPNIQAGLAKYPLYAAFGGTFGIDQNFNRLQVSGGATIDRIAYQNSLLTDGTISSNEDRNYNQFGGVGRVSYDLKPGLKPFLEVEADTRAHDQLVDRNGYLRNSDGGFVKGGTTFEFSRMLTGEAAIGWAAREYRGSAAAAAAGPLDLGLADMVGDAADHGEILCRPPRSTRPRCPASPAC